MSAEISRTERRSPKQRRADFVEVLRERVLRLSDEQLARAARLASQSVSSHDPAARALGRTVLILLGARIVGVVADDDVVVCGLTLREPAVAASDGTAR